MMSLVHYGRLPHLKNFIHKGRANVREDIENSQLNVFDKQRMNG
jgi:hypothetical protein